MCMHSSKSRAFLSGVGFMIDSTNCDNHTSKELPRLKLLLRALLRKKMRHLLESDQNQSLFVLLDACWPVFAYTIPPRH